jgi:chaperone modulatory protein CbpM
MIQFDAVIALFPDLPEPVIADWIARGWVRAEGNTRGDWSFAEIDIARIHLIRDLRIGMALDEHSLPLVLALLDEVYGLRRSLKAVLRAIDDQPPGMREILLAALARRPE